MLNLANLGNATVIKNPQHNITRSFHRVELEELLIIVTRRLPIMFPTNSESHCTIVANVVQ